MPRFGLGPFVKGILFVSLLAQPFAFAAPPATKNLAAKVTKKKRKKVKTSESTAPVGGNFGVAFGMFNFYPPQLTVEGLYRQADWVAGAEAGYIAIPLEQFSGNSTYVGVSGRYMLTKSFFTGLALGKRRIVIATKADTVVDDERYPVKWTRTADQTVIVPKVGWESYANQTSLLFSFGILIPTGTKFSIERDVDSIPGLPEEDFAEEEESKANDVKKITNATLPYLELKYGWFF